MPMAPERLQTIEEAAKDAIASDVQTGGFARDALALIAEIRRLTADLASAHADADAWRRSTRAVQAERDAAVAQAHASGQAEATLRGALGHIMQHLYGGIPLATYEDVARWPARMIIEEADAALLTPPTSHAKLATARAEYIAADRMPGGLPDSQEWRAKFDRLEAAKAALAEAEAEAEVAGQ